MRAVRRDSMNDVDDLPNNLARASPSASLSRYLTAAAISAFACSAPGPSSTALAPVIWSRNCGSFPCRLFYEWL